MEDQEQKRKKIIQFELTPLGLAGVSLVCCALFLWMFFMGVWAGQTILLPSQPKTRVQAAEKKIQPPADRQIMPANPEEKPRVQAVQEKKTGETKEDVAASFFALQIGAFSTEKRAKLVAEKWHKRGVDAFYQPPADSNDKYWRAFVGRFNELEEANDLAETLRNQDVKSFITLVNAATVRRP